MSKVLSDVRTQVRSFLDEPTAADWSNSELNTLINTYYHNVRSAVIQVYEDYYQTTAQFNTVANQQEYGSSDGVPTNIHKIRRVELNYDASVSSGAPTRMLPISNIDAVRRDLGYQNAGLGLKTYSNGAYYTYGFGSNFKIGFIPIPDKAGTNAVKIWYVKEESDLSSDSSSLDLPYVDKHWMLVAYGATSEALRFGQEDSAEADKYERKYDKGISLMQQELEDKISEESKFVLDVSGDYIDFQLP